MTGVDDAVEVEGLTFKPVGGGPDVHDGGHDGKAIVVAVDLHPQTGVVGDGQQVIDGGEAAGALDLVLGRRSADVFAAPAEAAAGHVFHVPLGVAVGGVVDATDIHQILEPEVVAQGQGGFKQGVGGDGQRDLIAGVVNHPVRAESRLQAGQYFGIEHV